MATFLLGCFNLKNSDVTVLLLVGLLSSPVKEPPCCFLRIIKFFKKGLVLNSYFPSYNRYHCSLKKFFLIYSFIYFDCAGSLLAIVHFEMRYLSFL